MHTQLMTAESEFDKQKSLLQQRVSFMEQSLTDSKQREEELLQEMD